MGKLPVTFDDSHAKLAWNAGYAFPQGVGGGAAIQFKNVSTGSSFSASIEARVNPGNSTWTVGPIFRMGGIGVGILAGKGGVTPEISVGGITMIPGAGVCAGFLCAGPKRAGLIDPKSMIIATVVQTISTIISMKREDSGLMILSDIVNNFIPIVPIIDTLAVMGVPLGRGPKATSIAQLSDMVRYSARIQHLITSNGRVDAIRRLKEALKLHQDPYIEAELRGLLDKAYVERNAKDLPFGNDIEKNIAAGVTFVETFRRKYGSWLKDGSGNKPTTKEIEKFMGRSLYLARKLFFTYERTKKKDKIVLKIRASAPFQIGKPELAVRYGEAMGALFGALASSTSGLAAYVRTTTNGRYKSLYGELGRKSIDPKRAMRAEARRAWHVGWLDAMGNLYRNGFFHWRLKHLRYIVARKASGAKKKKLLARIDAVSYIDKDVFTKSMSRLASITVSPRLYVNITPGLAALRAANELSAISFPDDMGDARLLFDRERARKYNRRPQIVDALYAYERLAHRIASIGKRKAPEKAILVKLAKAARASIIKTMARYRHEVRREWWDYAARPTGYWRRLTASRLRDAKKALKGYPDNGLFKAKFATWAFKQRSKKARLTLLAANGLMMRAQDLQRSLTKLIASARTFKQGKAPSLKALRRTEGSDSRAMNAFAKKWRSFIVEYARLKMKLVEAGAAKRPTVKKFFKKAEKQLRLTELYLRKAMANYERFNARRVGGYYLDLYMRRLRIAPIRPRSEDSCVVCP